MTFSVWPASTRIPFASLPTSLFACTKLPVRGFVWILEIRDEEDPANGIWLQSVADD